MCALPPHPVRYRGFFGSRTIEGLADPGSQRIPVNAQSSEAIKRDIDPTAVGAVQVCPLFPRSVQVVDLCGVFLWALVAPEVRSRSFFLKDSRFLHGGEKALWPPAQVVVGNLRLAWNISQREQVLEQCLLRLAAVPDPNV